MAKLVKVDAKHQAQLEELAKRKGTFGSRETKYAWSEWLDGNWHILERTVKNKDGTVKTAGDFEEDVSAFRNRVRVQGLRVYKNVQSVQVGPDLKPLPAGSIMVRAVPMDAAQRKAEDARRKEEAARRDTYGPARDAAKAARDAAVAAGKTQDEADKIGREVLKAEKAKLNGK